MGFDSRHKLPLPRACFAFCFRLAVSMVLVVWVGLASLLLPGRILVPSAYMAISTRGIPGKRTCPEQVVKKVALALLANGVNIHAGLGCLGPQEFAAVGCWLHRGLALSHP